MSRAEQRKDAEAEAKRLAFPVVGVGASAGGMESFSELLDHLPPDVGMAYVLIQHLAPKHKTILPEILSRRTSMPVALVENEMEIEPDHVYVIPPGVDMTVFHGRLNLMERSTAGGAHLPIDTFLRSLALDQHSRAVGIILSGSASDGALGLAAIKSEGGITFAQDPATAAYDGMPTAAIRANAADKVLPPAGIAEELKELGSHPYLVGDAEPTVVAAEAETESDWMNSIFSMLRSVFGVDFSTYRMSTIQRRIGRRMALYKMESLREYVDFLRERPNEIEDLYHDILIMVTEFFREPEAFQALSDVVLPRILDDKRPDDQVRVWVPGCSTGEEPYSIALAITRAIRQSGRELPVKIFATDISERDIDQARTGLYAENKFAGIPEEYRHYFARADGGYQISKSIRDLVIFARHDVTNDPPFSGLDLVSCRNLLIYLGPQVQERIIPIFHYALRPQGFLMLGASESVGSATDLFAPVDKKHKIFLKKAGTHRPLAFEQPFPFAHSQHREQGDGGVLVSQRRFDPQRAAEELLLDRYAPPSVVIDDANTIVQFRGATDDFLLHSSGRASLNVMEMAREGLATEIRTVLDKVRASDRPAARETVRYHAPSGIREVGIQAIPLKGAAGERYFLLVFRPSGHADEADRERAEADDVTVESGEREDLRRELEATRDYMQALVQDKEAALEELRAANEEIQSSNEELQSINEELETAKEELQSTNEELRTVNEELEHRNMQLSRANDDLNNLLRAVNVPTIMVGRDLRIRRFTPGSERVMSLIATDVGRPITDIALRLDVHDLGELLTQVIDEITVAERELRDEQGHWYSMRIRPYQTDDNRIEGAVITLVDVDELRSTLAKVTQASRLSEGMNQVLSALQGEVGVDEVMSVLLDQGTRAVDAEAALVILRDQAGWIVRYAHGARPDVVGERLQEGALPQATIASTTRAPVVVQSATGSSPFFADGFEDATWVIVPMIARERVTGVLLFVWSPGRHPDEAQTDFVAKLAALVPLALTRP